MSIRLKVQNFAFRLIFREKRKALNSMCMQIGCPLCNPNVLRKYTF